MNDTVAGIVIFALAYDFIETLSFAQDFNLDVTEFYAFGF